jgi:hypothetical protein
LVRSLIPTSLTLTACSSQHNNTKYHKFDVSLSEQSAIIRSLVQYENEIANHRRTAFATIQGLLFASIGLLSDKGELKVDNKVTKRFVCIIGALGMLCAGHAILSQVEGRKAINKLVEGRGGEGVIGRFPFPDVQNPNNALSQKLEWLRVVAVEVFFFLAWIAVLLAIFL